MLIFNCSPSTVRIGGPLPRMRLISPLVLSIATFSLLPSGVKGSGISDRTNACSLPVVRLRLPSRSWLLLTEVSHVFVIHRVNQIIVVCNSLEGSDCGLFHLFVAVSVLVQNRQ